MNVGGALTNSTRETRSAWAPAFRIQQQYRNGERSLAISIELNEIADPAVKRNVESVIRDCIGDRPKEKT
jgi:hypothetical protein